MVEPLMLPAERLQEIKETDWYPDNLSSGRAIVDLLSHIQDQEQWIKDINREYRKLLRKERTP